MSLLGFRHLKPLVLGLILAAAACQPFHPQDPISVPAMTGGLPQVAKFLWEEIYIELAAHDTLEQSLEIFDADLPRAGIHPVWVHLRNDGNHTLQFENAHISLQHQGSNPAQLIAPMYIVDLLYKNYHIRLYSPHFRSQLENRFEDARLKLTSLPPGKEASGYLFFLLEGRDYGLLRGTRLRWLDIKSSRGQGSMDFEYTFPSP